MVRAHIFTHFIHESTGRSCYSRAGPRRLCLRVIFSTRAVNEDEQTYHIKRIVPQVNQTDEVIDIRGDGGENLLEADVEVGKVHELTSEYIYRLCWPNGAPRASGDTTQIQTGLRMQRQLGDAAKRFPVAQPLRCTLVGVCR